MRLKRISWKKELPQAEPISEERFGCGCGDFSGEGVVAGEKRKKSSVEQEPEKGSGVGSKGSAESRKGGG